MRRLAAAFTLLFASGSCGITATADEGACADANGSAEALHLRAAEAYASADFRAAQEAWQKALAMEEAAADRLGQARSLFGLGLVHQRLGSYAAALGYEERALALRETGDRARLPETLRAVGVLHDCLGDYGKARECQERALALSEERQDRAGAAAALGNLGNVWWSLGAYSKALACQERALAHMEALGDAAGAAAVLANTGIVYQRLGEGERALAFFERALHRFEKTGDRSRVAATLENIGAVYWGLKDTERALAVLARARALSEEIGDRAGVAAALGNIGQIRWSQGNYPLALACQEESLALREETGDRAGVAATLGFLGAIAASLNDPEKALGYQRRALAEAEDLGAAEVVVGNLWSMAGTRLEAGEPEEAVASARRAIDEMPVLVRGLSDEQGASSRGQLAPIFEIGARAAEALDDPAEVSFFLESGRAGTLLEALGGRDALQSVVVPPAMRAAEGLARADEARALARYRKALDSGNFGESRARRAEFEASRDTVKETIERIQRDARAAANLVYPRAAPLDEIRSRLRPGEALVSYAMFSERTIALVATRGGARIVPIGRSDDVAARCQELAVDAPGPDPSERVAALRRMLVEPLALGEGVRRVLVSPDGALSYVPFSLLIGDRDVAYEPSGTTYLLLAADRERTGDGVLALGDPDYESDGGGPNALAQMNSGIAFVPLPGTREEAKAVGDVVLLGAESTEAGLRYAVSRRARWRAVHLACHGHVDAQRPALSSLALTPSGDDDGFLTALEVFGMRVPADLVVLSACETGRGKIVRGEGIVGLTRAFMFAGSPRVVVSLWNGDDKATRALMGSFYERWRAGTSTAAALAEAQRTVRAHAEWQHPYYWAGWVLWGLAD